MIFDINQKNVKFIGRTYFYKEALWCGLSGSGISFTFKGTRADITIAGDDTTQGVVTEGKARLAIYVNHKRVIDTMVELPEETFCVYENDVPQEVTVQIIKLSECPMSTFGIKMLDIQAENGIHPEVDKPHKIEFIGDSITCGYGVDLEIADTVFSTTTEDVTRAYAYKTAMGLNSDYSMVSFSGYGIISGYTDSDEKQVNQLVPDYYEKMGFSYAKPYGTLELQEVPWDFTSYVPDLIVMNLGTNDDSYCQDHKSRQEEFSQEYEKFLKQLRQINPQATLLCTVGLMGERIYDAVEKAVLKYKENTGDHKIYAIKLKEQLPQDGLVTSGHPTEISHTKAAAVLVENIKKIMNW